MDGGWWKPSLSLLEWKFTDIHRVEARVIHVAMYQNLRHQYEIMFSLTQTEMVPYKNMYRYTCICKSRHTYMSLLSQLR